MAMLAEPRRKQKVINLRAKNNAWSNDANKFGQRMLEKMGWSSGKGLGAHEDGIVEHVVARYKNDDRGLGFEDRNDQWTKHEDDFNALLANLSNDEKKEEHLHSGVSLEDKSKKSKARIHYHKFTRGKDMSRYSEKDLANIFGKKSLKNEQQVEEQLKDDIKTTEQVFTEKGSMEDYFKAKLANFKSASGISYLNSGSNSNSNDANYGFTGFSQTNNDDQETEPNCLGFGFQPFSSISKDSVENEKSDQDCKPKNNKKKSKRKDKSKTFIDEMEPIEQTVLESLPNSADDAVETDVHEQNDETSKKNKKKHKKEKSVKIRDETVLSCLDYGLEPISNSTKDSDSNKKIKRKSKDAEMSQNDHVVECDKNESNFLEVHDEEISTNSVKKSKKKKKVADENLDEEDMAPKHKKKKRKNKETSEMDSAEQDETIKNSPDKDLNVNMKKKKRKCE